MVRVIPLKTRLAVAASNRRRAGIKQRPEVTARIKASNLANREGKLARRAYYRGREVRIYKTQLAKFHTLYKINRSGCWLWQGKKDKDGYGKFYPCGGHVFAQLMYNEDVPVGGFVCHSCNVTSCVNPEHVYSGTPKSNVDDMIKAGRVFVPPPPMRGKKNPWYGKRPPIWDNISPEKRSEIAKSSWVGLSKEQRSARLKKGWAKIGKKERSNRMKKVWSARHARQRAK